MAMQINTNVLSLTAQRNAAASQASLSTAIERLSTGLRINSAGDDAAGLAISERFTSQIRGQTVAQRNANDAISFAQTAEGALSVMGDVLQRMRELTIQSINGLNTAGDRAALNQEVAQLRDEVERIAQDTAFNGLKTLDGGVSNINFQIGAGRGDVLSIDGVDARASVLGATFGTITTNAAVVAATGADYIADGVTNGAPAGTDDFTINTVPISLEGVATPAALVDAINAEVSQTGVEASLANPGGELVLTDASGNAPTIGGTEELLEAIGLDPDANDDGTIGDNTYTASTTFRGIDAADVSTVAKGNLSLEVIDSAIDRVTSLRAELGAMQNRFENVIEVVGIHRENLEAARSRILDADFAEETANLTRAQILQQAGLASLAQANSVPQSVLSLLQ